MANDDGDGGLARDQPVRDARQHHGQVARGELEIHRFAVLAREQPEGAEEDVEVLGMARVDVKAAPRAGFRELGDVQVLVRGAPGQPRDRPPRIRGPEDPRRGITAQLLHRHRTVQVALHPVSPRRQNCPGNRESTEIQRKTGVLCISGGSVFLRTPAPSTSFQGRGGIAPACAAAEVRSCMISVSLSAMNSTFASLACTGGFMPRLRIWCTITPCISAPMPSV